MLNSHEKEAESMLMHQTQPTLIKNDAGKYWCVYSHSSQKEHHVPSLYLHSLSKEPYEEDIKVEGAEIFVDWIPSKHDPHSGQLYYITERVF